MPHRSGPARPGTGVTTEGRPLQVVTSYARRGSRLTPKQQEAWDRHVHDWLVPDTVAEQGPFERSRWFGRRAPLVVEVGSGIGEVAVDWAAAHPAYDVLAIEVWRPGVASTFARMEDAGVGNVRVLSLDAAWVLEHLVAPGQLAGLWTFFPDPWHKKRHHKRRLVSSSFACLAASRLEEGAALRLATDWPDYAEHIRTVLDAEPLLTGGPTERWAERPLTRFERRGLREGRPVADFCYVRVG